MATYKEWLTQTILEQGWSFARIAQRAQDLRSDFYPKMKKFLREERFERSNDKPWKGYNSAESHILEKVLATPESDKATLASMRRELSWFYDRQVFPAARRAGFPESAFIFPVGEITDVSGCHVGDDRPSSVLDSWVNSQACISVDRTEDGKCRLSAVVHAPGPEGQLVRYERSVDLSRLMDYVEGRLRAIHDRLHQQDLQVSGWFGDAMSRVLRTGRMVAQAQATREIASDLLPLMIPGAQLTFAQTLGTAALVDAAKAGSPQAKREIKQVNQLAKGGDPKAKAAVQTMKSLSAAQEAAKEPQMTHESLYARGVSVGHSPVEWVGADGYVPKSSGGPRGAAALRARGVRDKGMLAAAERNFKVYDPYDGKWKTREQMRKDQTARNAPVHEAARQEYAAAQQQALYEKLQAQQQAVLYGQQQSPYGYGAAPAMPGYGAMPGMDPYGMGAGYGGLDPMTLALLQAQQGYGNDPVNINQRYYDPATDSFYSNEVQQQYDPTTDSFAPVSNVNPYNTTPYNPFNVMGWPQTGIVGCDPVDEAIAGWNDDRDEGFYQKGL